MGKFPWISFNNKPKKNIYNMDELAINTSGHRQKSLVNTGALSAPSKLPRRKQ